MSPIKDLTESVRLPRLGKIRLGTRHPEKGYPMKADHFVLPTDHSDYKKLVEVFGETPKELRILIPVEDEEAWGSQYYKAYNQTYGLVCKGDGENAVRMVSVETNQLPDAKKPGTVRSIEIPCAGTKCPEYQAKKCHEVMNFRFILPEIPGLGVWQIDTGSKNSILNINNSARIIRRAFGRISLIPLKLTFEPIQVNNPENGKKQTVYALNLRTEVTMAQLADAAREQSKMYALDMPNLEDVCDMEVEKDIQELWGNGETTTTEQDWDNMKREPEPTPEATEPSPSVVKEPVKEKGKAERNPASITSIPELQQALFDDFKMQPKEQLAELNLRSWREMTISPSDAYNQVKTIKKI